MILDFFIYFSKHLPNLAYQENTLKNLNGYWLLLRVCISLFSNMIVQYVKLYVGH